jgi:hypothetical protein
MCARRDETKELSAEHHHKHAGGKTVGIIRTAP